MKHIATIILAVTYSAFLTTKYFLNKRRDDKVQNKIQFLLDEQGELYELIDEQKEKYEELRQLVEVAHIKCDLLANSRSDMMPPKKPKVMN